MVIDQISKVMWHLELLINIFLVKNFLQQHRAAKFEIFREIDSIIILNCRRLFFVGILTISFIRPKLISRKNAKRNSPETEKNRVVRKKKTCLTRNFKSTSHNLNNALKFIAFEKRRRESVFCYCNEFLFYMFWLQFWLCVAKVKKLIYVVNTRNSLSIKRL